MMSLIEGFRGIYQIPSSRSFVKERAVAMWLVLIAAIPMLGASALIVFGNRDAPLARRLAGADAR